MSIQPMLLSELESPIGHRRLLNEVTAQNEQHGADLGCARLSWQANELDRGYTLTVYFPPGKVDLLGYNPNDDVSFQENVRWAVLAMTRSRSIEVRFATTNPNPIFGEGQLQQAVHVWPDRAGDKDFHG